MKRFLLMVTAIMFLANAYTVSAWATSCMNMDSSPSAADTSDMADTPCAEEGMQDTPSLTHCDGVCLCLHTAINQTPLINNDSGLNMPLRQSERLMVTHERIASKAATPPRRPPKTTS